MKETRNAFKKFLTDIGSTWYAACTLCMGVRIYTDAYAKGDVLWTVLGVVAVILSFCMLLGEIDKRRIPVERDVDILKREVQDAKSNGTVD